MSDHTSHNGGNESTCLKDQMKALKDRVNEEATEKDALIQDLYDKICALEDRLNNIRTTSNYVLGNQLDTLDMNFTNFKRYYRGKLEFLEEKIKSLQSCERDVDILRTDFDVHKKHFWKWRQLISHRLWPDIFPFLDIGNEEEGHTT